MSTRSDSSRNRYENRVRTIADSLRRMADEVERNGLNPGVSGGPLSARKAGENAAEVVHNVAWGTANLNLDLLLFAVNDWHVLENEDARSNV